MRCVACARCGTAASARSAPWPRTRLRNHSRLSNSSRSLSLKLSTKPFCHGLPGAMKAGPIAASRNQRMTFAAVNSAPLPERTDAGLPYKRISRDRVRTPSCAGRLTPTSMARHSRVYSSITHGSFRLRPSTIRSCTKSSLQTALRRTAPGRRMSLPLRQWLARRMAASGIEVWTGQLSVDTQSPLCA